MYTGCGLMMEVKIQLRFTTCSCYNKLHTTIQDLFQVMLFNHVHVLYSFQAGFPLAKAPVPFWRHRNLAPTSDACNSHSMLFHEHLLLCITIPTPTINTPDISPIQLSTITINPTDTPIVIATVSC